MSLKFTFSVAATATLLSLVTAQAGAGELAVEPSSAVLVGPHERLQMVATEHVTAGRPDDVTRAARSVERCATRVTTSRHDRAGFLLND